MPTMLAVFSSLLLSRAWVEARPLPSMKGSATSLPSLAPQCCPLDSLERDLAGLRIVPYPPGAGLLLRSDDDVGMTPSGGNRDRWVCCWSPSNTRVLVRGEDEAVAGPEGMEGRPLMSDKICLC